MGDYNGREDPFKEEGFVMGDCNWREDPFKEGFCELAKYKKTTSRVACISPPKRMFDDPSMPGTRHGSRVIACFFKNEIIIFNDTRITKDKRGYVDEIEIVNDNVSKSKVFENGIIGAYVGDDNLWEKACSVLNRLCKNVKGKKNVVIDLGELSKKLYEFLQSVPLGKDGEGIEMILGYHVTTKPIIFRIVWNNPDQAEQAQVAVNGYEKIEPSESLQRMHFITLGAGSELTDEYLQNICPKTKELNLELLLETIYQGMVHAFLNIPCIGGNVEVLRKNNKGSIYKEKKTMIRCFIDYYKYFKRMGVLLIFAQTKYATSLTSKKIQSHLSSMDSWVQEIGNILYKPGDSSRNKMGNMKIYCLLFRTLAEAKDALEGARTIDCNPSYRLYDLRCVKIEKTQMFVGLPSADFFKKLEKDYTIVC